MLVRRHGPECGKGDDKGGSRNHLQSQSLKRLLVRSLLLPGVVAPFSLFMKHRAVIFMLHRFHDSDLGTEGHDPARLRNVLMHLRKKHYHLLSLEELFRRWLAEENLERVVVFTIDDGYLEHATVAAPVFAEFDCPVTTFAATGFLDGRLWFWWDQIAYVFAHTERRSVSLALAGVALNYHWQDEHSRRRAHEDFAERCTDVSDVERLEAIRRLMAQAEVEPPSQPPLRYAPMSWDQARTCEKKGMFFGPHTVTHPVLSRTSDDESTAEIAGSWQRLCSELRHPAPIFCYPNGRLGDFGQREVATIKKLGLIGAVTGVSAYAEAEHFRNSLPSPYHVPRFGYPDNLAQVIQIVSGFERVKRSLLGRES
jgi:peptidoglycan/xylan/chitin deacetylase (PgdA/CDA1 family)